MTSLAESDGEKWRLKTEHGKEDLDTGGKDAGKVKLQEKSRREDCLAKTVVVYQPPALLPGLPGVDSVSRLHYSQWAP